MRRPIRSHAPSRVINPTTLVLTDEIDEDELVVKDENSDEDCPELVVDIYPYMDEEEEEFLEFSGKAQMIIISERKNHGCTFDPLSCSVAASKPRRGG